MAKSTGAPRQGLTSTFSAPSSGAMSKVVGSVPATLMVTKIQEKGDRIKERAKQHHKNFEDRWVANETLRLWQRHLEVSAKLPVPKGVTPKVTVESFSRTASHNVTARTNRRLGKINAIVSRMSNAVARNLPPTSLKRNFNEAAPMERAIKNPTMKR